MPDFDAFFFGSSPAVVQLGCLEITHPDFTTSTGAEGDPRPSGVQEYRLVRNAADGVEVTHEGPAGPFQYAYMPARILPLSSQNDLVQSLSIVLGDVGAVIAKEIAAVSDANGMNVRPTVAFRTYRSDDLTEPLGNSSITLEIVNVTTEKDGASFQAAAPDLNTARTGELYDLERFVTLRGFS